MAFKIFCPKGGVMKRNLTALQVSQRLMEAGTKALGEMMYPDDPNGRATHRAQLETTVQIVYEAILKAELEIIGRRNLK